jgi:hypothetical protein
MTLWTKLYRKEDNRSPHKHAIQIPKAIRRASFYTCKKASYTLEAAVVIPLMAAYLVTLLFFFSILEIQCEVDEALLYAGRKTAVESSTVEEEELLFLSAKAYVLYALEDNSLVQKHIENGAWGIQLWRSDFWGEDIILRAEYEVKLPISVFGIDHIELSAQNRFRKWNGDRILEEQGDYVYVTPNGEVYHMGLTCRSINLSVKQTTRAAIGYLRGKNGQKYYECSRCDWKDKKKERVYYTDYGTLYHKDIACSAIKRTVERVKIDEVTERRPCSFCYK